MLKKLFKIVTLFSVLCLIAQLVLLFYRKNSTYIKLWEMKTEAPKASQEKSQTLGPCRDTPPTLVGPLHVEFDSKRTLDEVRNVVSSNLQEGGRYKPPDCVSRQKVGG